jgi:hypothetical protein
LLSSRPPVNNKAKSTKAGTDENLAAEEGSEAEQPKPGPKRKKKSDAEGADQLHGPAELATKRSEAAAEPKAAKKKKDRPVCQIVRFSSS